ncbi:MAG: hypothetical protein ACREBW_02915 [Candidatus Micrarchaeaceae archaeon]
MNVTRLREIVDLLLAREAKFKIQQTFGEVNSSLTNLASNPQDQNFQTQYAAALEKLRTTMQAISASLTPAEVKEIGEIGAGIFFSAKLADQIGQWVSENPISPAVAQKFVAQLFAERNTYIQTITQLRDNFNKLQIQPHSATEKSAEIGFLLPRDLFKNHLDELIDELAVINRILRTFSGLATGKVSPVEVKQISTTDPLFFFGLDPITIALLGGVITWALAQWETIEKIRKLRSDTVSV